MFFWGGGLDRGQVCVRIFRKNPDTNLSPVSACGTTRGLTLERHPVARGMKEVVNTARVHLAVFSGLQLKMVVIFFNYCIEDIG